MMTALASLVLMTVGQAGEDAERQRSNEVLLGMRLRAESTKVAWSTENKRGEASPSSDPLFRYSDQPRDILDATLWSYGGIGRPVAVQKIEFYRRPEDRTSWFYCMASLSESRIEVTWRDGQTWSSEGAGTTMHDLPEGPQPAESQTARLFQMKNIARRFASTLYDDLADLRVDMRLLARPIHRYADANAGLEDGAIFGFATAGTNPDALLLIELYRSEGTERRWRYGLARMTTGRLVVRLDEEQIWQVPYVHPTGPGRPSKFDTWLFFHETPVPEMESKR